MKKTILLLGGLTITVNILLGVLISVYSVFNMGVNCGIIAINTVLLVSLYVLNVRDAFRISFSFLFSILAIVEIILGCLMPQKLQDNGYLIASLVSLFFEIIPIVVINILSNKIKK
ncbi:MAG: hypothetical protein PUK04_04855 [Bacteroidales bacterium]|nr:hypothetical protein [Bacteroidales bacterium]MDY4850365.1 hypothetical protein [Paludibacteraceae bacterium]MDY6036433.1 hypothetical protein [Paludibacteraceae bacterium]